jgi:hypothetical protein
MRAGFAFVANRETEPTAAEQIVIRQVIRDCHVTSVGEWLTNQKPKIRAKFMSFLDAVNECPMPDVFSAMSRDVAERFARDIIQHQFHPVIRCVLDGSDGEFADVLHILSLHMQRSNLMASVPSVPDTMPQLLMEIAQEDHVYSRPAIPRHELPRVAAQPFARPWMSDPLPRMPPTRSFKPGSQRSSPFATFPDGQRMQTMSRSQFVGYGPQARTGQSGVCNVLNAPTCL